LLDGSSRTCAFWSLVREPSCGPDRMGSWGQIGRTYSRSRGSGALGERESTRDLLNSLSLSRSTMSVQWSRAPGEKEIQLESSY
jgi:hypothetical protein